MSMKASELAAWAVSAHENGEFLGSKGWQTIKSQDVAHNGYIVINFKRLDEGETSDTDAETVRERWRDICRLLDCYPATGDIVTDKMDHDRSRCRNNNFRNRTALLSNISTGGSA